MNETHDIAIVGGGASGLAAAVAAGQAARQLGLSANIAVFERDERVGRTILATGNGRCNFTNEHIGRDLYHNGPFVGKALEALADGWSGAPGAGSGDVAAGSDAALGDPCEPVLDFFESLGLEWRQEADGRRYPLANKASVVLDVLRAAAQDLGVQECCGQAVSCIEAPRSAGGPFTLRMADGVFNRARSVVVSCGGRAVDALQIEGVGRRSLRPMLGPLRCSEQSRALTRELDNIRVRCGVLLLREQKGAMVCVGSESGEVLFRPYGVSGICVYDLSRQAQPGDVLAIDLLQAGGIDEAQAYLDARWHTLSQRYGTQLTYERFLRGLVLPRVADALLKFAGLQENQVCMQKNLPGLARLLSRVELEIEGIGDVRQCQVHRGGLDVECFDAASMQAHDVPGLFATGEALDVDGPCGGYNLHWAWASGLLAGASALRALAGETR